MIHKLQTIIGQIILNLISLIENGVFLYDDDNDTEGLNHVKTIIVRGVLLAHSNVYFKGIYLEQNTGTLLQYIKLRIPCKFLQLIHEPKYLPDKTQFITINMFRHRVAIHRGF